MNINEIMESIPHRYPFLLVDRVLEMDLMSMSIVGQKNVSINESFFQGHFRDAPVMPGVLIVEALAQVTSILADRLLDEQNLKQNGGILFLAGMDKVKFRKMVGPGDVLILKSTVTHQKSGIYKCSAKAYVGDQLACSADLTAAYRKA
jgi:3-hydroxyacyl-[acyl-carrier-protein] dehydratase